MSTNEHKLLNAITKVTDLVNGGESPTEAVFKVASDMQLRAGDVRLVSQAYNTGRTRRQQEIGNDPLEKAADFDLADAGNVIERLYPTQCKTAAQTIADTAVSSDYDLRPDTMLGRRKQAAYAAVTLPQVIKEAAAREPEPIRAAQVALGTQQRRKRAVDEARRQSRDAFEHSLGCFNNLARYFNKLARDRLSYGTVKDAAETMFGSQGARVMERIGAYMPHILKEATTRIDYSPELQPLPMIQDMIESVHRRADLDANYVKVAAAAFDATRVPRTPHPSDSVLAEDAVKEAGVIAPFALGLAGGLANNTMGPMTQQLQPQDTATKVKSTMQDLSDPAHESTLRNLRVRALLQDLQTEDPVIGSYPQQDVLNAYNAIGELSPRAVDQKLLVQGLLRRQLEQGNMDPHEADQLLDIDSKLQRRDAPNASTSVL